MKALTALLISDGRPGHYHLSEGIIAAARRIRPITVERLEVQRRWSPHALGALWNARIAPARMLHLAHGLPPAALPQVDFVVSAGAETLAANVAAASLLGVPNIFYGSLRWFRPESFALVLTSYVENARHPHHRMMLKPSSLDFTGAVTRDLSLGPNRPPKIAALLVGGTTTGFQYTGDDWKRLLEFVEAAYRALGTRWLATNSRRTPPHASDALTAEASRSAGPIASFVDVRSAGPGTLGPLLAAAEAVICTDDSSSMVSESVSARLPIVGVKPRQAAFRRQEAGYRRFLAENGWYRSIMIDDLSPERFLAELGQIRPLKDDPLDRLAGVLGEQLSSLFRKS